MTTDEKKIEEATAHLMKARDLLKDAACPKTVERVRLAISSAKGASRAASHRKYRDERRAQRTSKAG